MSPDEFSGNQRQNHEAPSAKRAAVDSSSASHFASRPVEKQETVSEVNGTHRATYTMTLVEDLWTFNTNDPENMFGELNERCNGADDGILGKDDDPPFLTEDSWSSSSSGFPMEGFSPNVNLNMGFKTWQLYDRLFNEPLGHQGLDTDSILDKDEDAFLGMEWSAHANVDFKKPFSIEPSLSMFDTHSNATPHKPHQPPSSNMPKKKQVFQTPPRLIWPPMDHKKCVLDGSSSYTRAKQGRKTSSNLLPSLPTTIVQPSTKRSRGNPMDGSMSHPSNLAHSCAVGSCQLSLVDETVDGITDSQQNCSPVPKLEVAVKQEDISEAASSPWPSPPESDLSNSSSVTELESIASSDNGYDVLDTDHGILASLASELVGNLLETFSHYRAGYGNRTVAANGHTKDYSTPDDSQGNTSNQDLAEATTQGLGKRKRKDLLEDEPGDDENNEDHPAKRPSDTPQDARDTVLWACPYSKWKPLSYQSCYKYILKDISRVKQHLNRSHERPFHCPTCWEIFQGEDDFYAHIRDRTCTSKPVKVLEGVTPSQKKLLERRVDKKLSKRDQWYSVYSILFPDQTLPTSPYVEAHLSSELLSFQDFMVNQGLRIVETTARTRIPVDLLPHQEEIVAFSQTLFQQAIPEILEKYEHTRPFNNSPDSGYATASCASSASSGKLPVVVPNRRPDAIPERQDGQYHDEPIPMDLFEGLFDTPVSQDDSRQQYSFPTTTSESQPYSSAPDSHFFHQQTTWDTGEASFPPQSEDRPWSANEYPPLGSAMGELGESRSNWR